MRYSTCQNSIFAFGDSVMFVVFHSGPLDPSTYLTAHRMDTKIVTWDTLRYSGTNTKSQFIAKGITCKSRNSLAIVTKVVTYLQQVGHTLSRGIVTNLELSLPQLRISTMT